MAKSNKIIDWKEKDDIKLIDELDALSYLEFYAKVTTYTRCLPLKGKCAKVA